MKYSLFFITIFFSGLLIFDDLYESVIFGIFLLLIYRILAESSKIFVFREWALLLYAINYLLAPAITYRLPEDQVTYGMKIPFDEYFGLALPGFILFSIGMYALPTRIFQIDFKSINSASVVNQSFLIKITIIGILLRITTNLFPGELAFFVYLLSLIRFVGAFALLSVHRKFWYWTLIVLTQELFVAFVVGMYHDAIMWLIFFSLYWIYSFKSSLQFKLIGLTCGVFFILLIQAIKYDYREQTWTGEKAASLETITDLGLQKAQKDQLLGQDNLLKTLNRGNQAWIFASTVDNMGTKKNFQGLNNVNKYLEAALLPRFLAPNKIKAGNQEIFNEFSGHFLSETTSMGLGIFADGYIAYGAWGVYIFGFVLGLIFSLTFKLVERWTKISPFYVLLLLPLLNYAVRPDCELQTTINHLFKGILLYGFLVYLTRKRFTLDSQENQRKLMHLNLASTKK